MDEPLSNLDAKLRAKTRADIRSLQRRVGTTTVYVTHDQVEAMTMGDRIAIMRDGVIEQVGDPDSVYEQPATNLARAGADRRDGSVGLTLGDVRVTLETETSVPAEVIVGVRPEHTRLWDSEPGLIGPVDARVDYVEALGRETLLGVTGPAGTNFVIEADGRVRAEPGDTLLFGLRKGWLYLFDVADERALGRI